MPRSPEQGPRSPEVAKPKEWREVTRAHEVVAIGDLHGRREALLENGVFGRILTEQPDGTLSWEGDDKRVVFLGDILADRFLDGPQILADIHHLSTEAEKAGGEVTLLAGNHDIWGFSYLFNEGHDKASAREHISRAILTQGRGMFAFLPLAGIALPENLNTTMSQHERVRFTFETLMQDDVRQAIRHRIAQSPEIQNHYTQYRILHRIDDTLFTHCDPTPEMIEHLLETTRSCGDIEKAIQKINTAFQENIVRCLKDPEAKPNDEYKKLTELYISTENRNTFSATSHIDELRKQGINAAIHGHSSPQKTTHGDFPAHTFPREFLVLTADNQALMNDSTLLRRSVATIQKDGEIFCGEHEKQYRAR